MTPQILAPIALAATVAIAPVNEALTFARIDVDGRRRALLVQSYERGEIQAIDLSVALGRATDDPITAYREHGYEALAALASTAPPAAHVQVLAGELTVPVDLGAHHIAAGTNYPEHAGEAGVKDGPFLFAKLVTPTPPHATISAGAGLLDYEVELAFVTLDEIRRDKVPAEMGVMLCNDYTDRETLLRHIDVWNVASGDGFTTGKSFPGYLPVGDLFVIARDYRAFAAARELHLDVNGTPRQSSVVSAQIWNSDALLAETWKRRDQRWEHDGRQVSLLGDGGVIAARTLILSGTPAGTVFQDVSFTHKLKGLASWLLGGFSGPVASKVIDSYVGDPDERARYLQPGDRVTIRVDYLGTIDNEIVP